MSIDLGEKYIGPLNFKVNLTSFPKGATEILPKFSGDGKVSTYDHLSAFHTICGVIIVPSQQIAKINFVQTFIREFVEIVCPLNDLLK